VAGKRRSLPGWSYRGNWNSSLPESGDAVSSSLKELWVIRGFAGGEVTPMGVSPACFDFQIE